MKRNMKKQKSNKKVLYIALIILILLSSIIILSKTGKSEKIDNIKQQATGLTTNSLGDITNQIAATPNAPQLSAGMIPIKWNGSFWEVADKSKPSSWYNYANGSMATMMLNDGKYTSEKDTTGKPVPEIGTEIQLADMGTIFTWVPKFAYNESNEIYYLKAASRIAGDYKTPEIFTYSASAVKAEDIALRGVWIEQSTGLTSKVSTSALNLESNSYGLIGNTKAEALVLDANFINSINQSNETGIKDITSTKVVLKVIDEKLTEPIMAKLSAKGKIVTIEIIKTDNGIKEIVHESGIKSTDFDGTKGTIEVQEGGKNKFIIIDNIGNQREYEITVVSPEIYVLTNQDNYVEFNGVKWYPHGTQVRIQYVDDMTGLTGYYKEINGTTESPATWSSNGTSKYRTFTLTETMIYEAKIENKIGEVLGETEAKIHIMPLETSIPTNYYNNNIGGMYPVKATYISDGSDVYGTETYYYSTRIRNAAKHMGLLKDGDTDKLLYIKIQPSPQGGYIGSTRHGVTSSSYTYNYNGYIFVTKDGEEIKLPIIKDVAQKIEDNKITVSVDAKSYNTDETIVKYYYSIDNEAFVESSSKDYVFENVQAYKNHTIQVYVEDSYGIISQTTTMNTKTSNALPIPTIEIVDEETLETIEYDDKIWYPYGTKIKISYADDMTNLIGYFKTINETTGEELGWYSTKSVSSSNTLTESMTYIAKTKDDSGEETEEVRLTVHIMPYTKGILQENYYKNLGEIYPVRVTGYNSGSVYGTDTYMYQSAIQKSAIHMGLVAVDETKDLYIKIVKSPSGEYKSTTKNGIQSSSGYSGYNGYIFVTVDGQEIRSPEIKSTVLTSGENTITATVTATPGIDSVKAYYYSIDDGAFIECTDNVYTFENVEPYKNHTIKVYAKNTYGAISDTISVIGKTSNAIPIPTIEIVDEANIKTITDKDGVVWYPYNTYVQATFAENMTNLKAYYKYDYDESGTETSWRELSSSTANLNFDKSGSVFVKLRDLSGAESEEVGIHLNIMARGDSSLQTDYYTYGLGKIYPTRVVGDSWTIYGTDTYRYNTYIEAAAMHMGLLEKDEEKDLFIKIVESPVGGYKASTKNGITSYEYKSADRGYIFVTKEGIEIKSPTLNSLTTTSGENKVIATVNMNYYNSTASKYYYSIDNGTYIESDSNVYTFENVAPYKNHTIKVYAKDSNGAISQIYETTGKASNVVPTPVIEIVDKDSLETVEYDGKTWYPYGTQIKITYAEDLTNLTPYYRYSYNNYDTGWNKDSSNLTHTFTDYHNITYYAKNIDSTGEEAVSELTIYIMPGEDLSSHYANYYVGEIFPVIVTGTTSGSIYGTDIYRYSSDFGKAAMHMGILAEGETKQLFVKVVENQDDYYRASTKNGINSSEHLDKYNGYVFLDDNKQIIESPKITDLSISEVGNSIRINVSATSQNGSSIDKYYYSINNGEYIESNSSAYEYTSNMLISYVVKVYVKDTRGACSEIENGSGIINNLTEEIKNSAIELNATNAYNNTIIGNVYKVNITGTTSGSVWGTDIYTSDSSIATAAVHAGVLQKGQTGTVYILILEGQSSYESSTRNGITSSSFSSWPSSYCFFGEYDYENDETGKIEFEITMPEGTTYTTYNNEKWYPYGTQITINYTGNGTRTHYYAYSQEFSTSINGWYSISTSSTWNTTVYQSTTYFAKITDSSGNILAEESVKINIMPQASGYASNQSSYWSYLGNIYPVQVTGTTSGTAYGTNNYKYNSNINTAATHMGLVSDGQTKTVLIKISEYPSSGTYTGSTNNGVTTSNYSTGSYYGFVFVDEQGNEIYSYPIGEQGATLSGYSVINNGIYNFVNEGSSLIANNRQTSTGIWNTANSYIELDLTNEDASSLYKITLNAEITAPSVRCYGYATVTKNTNAPVASDTSGRFIYIRNTVEPQDYTTYIVGGEKYYLHLGYYRYDSHPDGVRFNSLNVQKIDDSPQMRIVSDVEPVIYNGEEWYPYNTQFEITYDEKYPKYYKMEYTDGTSSRSSTSNAVKLISLQETQTVFAGYTEECTQISKKINIMPYEKGVNIARYYNNMGAIYPVRVTGTSSGTTYGTAKYTYDSYIDTAATHMGLVDVGETDTVFIKIIEFPEGGYKASRNNGITSKVYTSLKNGYIFVDSAGKEILEPLVIPNATLSGYPVYSNNTYYFENIGDSLVSNIATVSGAIASSYIEIDLSTYTKDDVFSIKLNAETSCYYYGYAHITTTKEQTTYNNSTGRFFYVNNITEPTNYETTIPGGQKYYLHLGHNRYSSYSTGDEVVKFHSLKVEQIQKTDIPTITIDPNAVPVEYNGELWYPNGTEIIITFGEEKHQTINNNYYNYIKYVNEISGNVQDWYTFSSVSGVYTTNLYYPVTYYAKYAENSDVASLKINIMPAESNSSNYMDKLYNIYPVQVTGHTSGGGYGNNVYAYYVPVGGGAYLPSISSAATHMGLVSAEETKLLYIKTVEPPEGGYASVTKNGTSSSTTTKINGFMFVTEDGKEILEPIINNATAVIGSESTIVATVDATGQNGAKVLKYYYSIDNGAYVESDSNTYTFTDVASYKTHTVKVYVRDNNNAISQIAEVVTSVITNNVTPTITLDPDVTPIIYNGEEWYPYGTTMTINYAEDMTNLTAYYKYIDERDGTEIDWRNHSGNKTYTTPLYHSVTYMAKIADKNGKETDVESKTIRVMPCATGSPGTSYYMSYLDSIYPVQVTGTATGSAYGTDKYHYTSNISTAATHMGVINSDEPDVVYVKICEAPVGGYRGSTRNGVTTSGHSNTNTGFTFVDENEQEIVLPKVNSLATSSGDNSITVTVDAKSPNGNIVNYYYSIDNGEYVETTQNIHTFTNVTYSGPRTIRVYVKDRNGDFSAIKEVTGRRNMPTPVITANQEPVEYNGEKWYPYNTQITITFAPDSMGDLTGYYRTINVHTNSMSSWSNTSNITYTTKLSESMIYEMYLYEYNFGEGEHIRETINIMPNPDSLQSNYYNYGSGKTYPVLVTGRTGGGYGTDTYMAHPSYFTNIGVAAVHKGLVAVGEEKLVFIKIVPCPEGGYVGSARNGITTSTFSTAYLGYAFVQ